MVGVGVASADAQSCPILPSSNLPYSNIPSRNLPNSNLPASNLPDTANKKTQGANYSLHSERSPTVVDML